MASRVFGRGRVLFCGRDMVRSFSSFPSVALHKKVKTTLSRRGSGVHFDSLFKEYVLLREYGALPLRETTELMFHSAWNVHSMLRLLEDLVQYEDFSDENIFETAMGVCARRRAPHACHVVMDMMKKKNVKIDSDTVASLILAYGRSNQHDEALNVYRRYIENNKDSQKSHRFYSAVINVCGTADRTSEALKILRRYVADSEGSGQLHIRPFNATLGLLARSKEGLHEIPSILNLVDEHGVMRNFATFDISIGGFSERAKECFSRVTTLKSNSTDFRLSSSSPLLKLESMFGTNAQPSASSLSQIAQLEREAESCAQNAIQIFRSMLSTSSLPPSTRMCNMIRQVALDINDKDAVELAEETLEMVKALEEEFKVSS